MEHAASGRNAVDWCRYAECYDALLTLRPYQALLDEVVGALQVNAEDVVLDAGCGTGNLLVKLYQNHPSVRFVGIDNASTMLARAQEKFPHNTLEFLYSDMNGMLPFADRTFTKVAQVNALYALKNPEQVLGELRRVLAPRGSIVISTPKWGYENGLILKAHCGSVRPEAFWQNAHRTPKYEEILIREAIDDEEIVQQMLLVAAHNRTIVRSDYHFFTEEGLVALAQRTGFHVTSVTLAYADQNILLTAERR